MGWSLGSFIHPSIRDRPWSCNFEATDLAKVAEQLARNRSLNLAVDPDSVQDGGSALRAKHPTFGQNFDFSAPSRIQNSIETAKEKENPDKEIQW